MSRRAVQIATGLALAGTAAAIWTVAHRLRPGAAPMTQAALRAPPAADAFDTPFVPPPPPP